MEEWKLGAKALVPTVLCCLGGVYVHWSLFVVALPFALVVIWVLGEKLLTPEGPSKEHLQELERQQEEEAAKLASGHRRCTCRRWIAPGEPDICHGCGRPGSCVCSACYSAHLSSD